MLEKSYRRALLLTLSISVLLVLVELLEVYEQTFSELHFGRRISTGLAYAVRPFLILVVGYVSLMFKKSHKIILAIPAVINAILSLISIFTPLVFDFTETNNYLRGTLWFLPMVTGFFYLAGFTILSFFMYKKLKRVNTIIFFVIFVAVGGAAILEFISGETRALTAASVVAVLIYYIYLLTINYRTDPLTNTLNRHIFYLDADSRKESLSSMILMDMNGLKKLNDTKGHSAGDNALCTLAECCRKHLGNECNLYRVGGDEFIILCFNIERGKTREIADAVIDEISKTPFSVAVGIAYKEPDDTLDRMYKRADVEMYANKQEFKARLAQQQNEN